MNLAKSALACVMLLTSGIVLAGPTDSGQPSPADMALSPDRFVVFKNSAGGLSREALRNLAYLQDAAAAQGMVKVWITFNTPFQGDPALRTDAVIAKEAAAREAMMALIMPPMVAAGSAEVLETPSYLAQAPGCLANVDARALGRLAHQSGVQHIRYMR